MKKIIIFCIILLPLFARSQIIKGTIDNKPATGYNSSYIKVLGVNNQNATGTSALMLAAQGDTCFLKYNSGILSLSKKFNNSYNGMVITNSGLIGGILFDKYSCGINNGTDTSAGVSWTGSGGISHSIAVNKNASRMKYLRTATLGNYLYLKKDSVYLTMNNIMATRWDTLGKLTQYKDALFNQYVYIIDSLKVDKPLILTSRAIRDANDTIIFLDIVKFNTTIGYKAGNAITSGTHNTLLGYNSGKLLTTLGNNTIIGYLAGSGVSTIEKSVIIGAEAGTTCGAFNTFIGYYSGRLNTGQQNSAFGYYSLAANGAGSYNVAFGPQSLTNNTSGDNNIGIGFAAGNSNTTGLGNICIGYRAGQYANMSNHFYVNNINQINVSNDTTYSLIYGTFSGVSASLAGQRLKMNADIILLKTITAVGTTGNQTINKTSGRVNIAASGTTITVTNNLVNANSIIMVSVATNDATCTIKNVVAGAGSFVITVVATTAETAINFLVTN